MSNIVVGSWQFITMNKSTLLLMSFPFGKGNKQVFK